jgi:hypothetical protein
MNDTFSAKRFAFLFKKTLLERPTQLFGFMGLILALILILYFVAKSLIGFGAAQNIAFIWGLAGGGCFLASFVFGYFSSNANGSSYLTLPASHVEKWLCGVLMVGVLYPLIFLLFFRAIDAGFVALFHNSLDPENPLFKQQYNSVYLFSFTGRIATKVYTMFIFLTGVALIGSLYFNKATFIKTALFFCALCFILFGLNWLIAILLFGRIESAFPFRDVGILVGKEIGSVELPKNVFTIMGYILDYFVPLLLWVLTYIRLREKEF